MRGRLYYGTYVPAILESRLYFQSKSTARGLAVSFLVLSCDSNFNVSDLPAQRLERHSIVNFSDPTALDWSPGITFGILKPHDWF